MKKITKEFKDKTIAELTVEVNKIREQIAKAVLAGKASPAKNTNEIPNMKKKLAVLLTLLSNKKAIV